MPQIELSWSVPRLESGDFSPEDPLAIDHLQQQVGNILWPGFTTRTNRAFYYVMVCYGLRIIDDLLSKHGIIATDDNRRAWFERWEKLWALAICASFDGAIPGGDAMRGKRGVIRAWQSTDRLFLGYPLISRQLELGAMGAYRSSLVQHRLLSPNALLPTPIGAKLGDLMWEGGQRGPIRWLYRRVPESEHDTCTGEARQDDAQIAGPTLPPIHCETQSGPASDHRWTSDR